MEKLQDTLLIFNKLSIEMGNRTIAMQKATSYDVSKINKIGQDLSVLNSLMNMNITDSCSFMDEYDNIFGVKTEEKYKGQILEIKKICKTLSTQIRKWKDLQKVRNSFIAHNLRTKDKVMVFRNEINWNAPRGVYEVELLNNCIQLISHIIEKEFIEIFRNAKENFKLQIVPA